MNGRDAVHYESLAWQVINAEAKRLTVVLNAQQWGSMPEEIIDMYSKIETFVDLCAQEPLEVMMWAVEETAKRQRMEMEENAKKN